MRLSKREKTSYGLAAVGKDMVYMLSATYVLYYFQDVMGVSAIAMGIILMAARVFDAFNDPLMGIIVAKTRTRFGKFRPCASGGDAARLQRIARQRIPQRMERSVVPIFLLFPLAHVEHVRQSG